MGTINTVIKIPYYGIVNFIIVILQIIACSAFSLVIYIFASEIRTNKQIEEIKKALSLYFAKRVSDDMDALWDSGEWSLEKNEAVLEEHLRTPYRH